MPDLIFVGKPKGHATGVEGFDDDDIPCSLPTLLTRILGRSNTDLGVSAPPADGLLFTEGDAGAGRRWRRVGVEAEGRASACGTYQSQNAHECTGLHITAALLEK